jgi:hypothetical protein
MRLCRSLILVAIAGFGLLAADLSRVESFDTSGMPRRPTMFLEQQILDLIGSHQAGDLADAARIQGKLGRYYAEKGDEKRSQAAFMLAAAAKDELEGHTVSTDEPPVSAKPVAAPAPEAVPSPDHHSAQLTGNYFGFEGRLLHTWEFNKNGTFLHTRITSGSGTSVRNSERGHFRLSGDTLELAIASAASGFATPSAGGKGALLGGSNESTAEVRKLRIEFLKVDKSIVLDGIKLKPKSW